MSMYMDWVDYRGLEMLMTREEVNMMMLGDGFEQDGVGAACSCS